MKILAIDPGANLGWASDISGRLEWGTADFSLRRVSTEGLRWLKFTRWLEERTAPVAPRDLHVMYEMQNNFNRGNSSSGELAKIFSAFLLEFCEKRGIPCEAIQNQKLKAFAIPARPRPKKGEPKHPPLDRSKDAMIAAATTWLEKAVAPYQTFVPIGVAVSGFIVPKINEHEADALILYRMGRAQAADHETRRTA